MVSVMTQIIKKHVIMMVATAVELMWKKDFATNAFAKVLTGVFGLHEYH